VRRLGKVSLASEEHIFSMTPQRRVIFICTGNYYRSRYAEIYFNARVPAASGYYAVSRGFRLSSQNAGQIAPCVLDRLHTQQIVVAEQMRSPRQLQAEELTETDRVIVLDETEHRRYVEQDLPTWRARITYWHVPDIHDMPVEQALQLIEIEVDALLRQLLHSAELTTELNPSGPSGPHAPSG
jgi:protein-tyrosine phosphatase